MSCLAVADGEGRNGVWLAGQREHDDIIREGAGHSDMSALIDIVAIKIN